MSYSQDPNYWKDDDEAAVTPRRRETFVPAQRPAASVRRLSAEESAALTSLTTLPVQPPASIQLPGIEGTHTGHTRHEDNPVINAKASLLYSVAYMAVAALVIGALLILTDIADGDPVVFIGFLILGTGLVGFFAMGYNRQQGLHHSATGIAHAELTQRTEIYNRLAEVEEHRIDKETEVRLAEIEVRRQLGQEFVKRLGGGE